MSRRNGKPHNRENVLRFVDRLARCGFVCRVEIDLGADRSRSVRVRQSFRAGELPR